MTVQHNTTQATVETVVLVVLKVVSVSLTTTTVAEIFQAVFTVAVRVVLALLTTVEELVVKVLFELFGDQTVLIQTPILQTCQQQIKE
jgi:hypothetical protein